MNISKFLLYLVFVGMSVSNMQGMKRRWRLLPRVGDLAVLLAGGSAGYVLGKHVEYDRGLIDRDNKRSQRYRSRNIDTCQCKSATPIGSVLAAQEDFRELDDRMLDAMCKFEEYAQKHKLHVLYQQPDNYGEFCVRLALAKQGIYIKKLDCEEGKEFDICLRIEDSWDIENLDLDLVSKIRTRIKVVMQMECQYFVQYTFFPRDAFTVMSNPAITSRPFMCNIELVHQLARTNTDREGMIGSGQSLLYMSIKFSTLPDFDDDRRKIEQEVEQITQMINQLELGAQNNTEDKWENLECYDDPLTSEDNLLT